MTTTINSFSQVELFFEKMMKLADEPTIKELSSVTFEDQFINYGKLVNEINVNIQLKAKLVRFILNFNNYELHFDYTFDNYFRNLGFKKPTMVEYRVYSKGNTEYAKPNFASYVEKFGTLRIFNII
jgi:hypothetical protein